MLKEGEFETKEMILLLPAANVKVGSEFKRFHWLTGTTLVLGLFFWAVQKRKIWGLLKHPQHSEHVTNKKIFILKTSTTFFHWPALDYHV